MFALVSLFDFSKSKIIHFHCTEYIPSISITLCMDHYIHDVFCPLGCFLFLAQFTYLLFSYHGNLYPILSNLLYVSMLYNSTGSCLFSLSGFDLVHTQGSFTGPKIFWSGSSLRTEATGYGLVLF